MQSSPGKGGDKDHDGQSGRHDVRVTVPDVVGKTDTAADAELGSLGLKVKDANERKGGSGGGTKVISQAPSPGTKVAPGSTVTITLAAPAKKGSDSGEG
jgi:beta-lactam-binding protein with PASTA domain